MEKTFSEMMQEMLRRHQAEIENLEAEYAFKNAKYKVGQIIEDHIGFAKIINASKYYLESGTGLPKIVYRCENLTKKLEQQKREPIRYAYEGNIKRSITP